MTDPTPPEPGLALDATVRRPGARRREALRRIVAAVVVVVVLAGIGLGARAALGSSSSRGLRTATVATRSVDEVVQLVATVEPVSQASVAFPVAGTVSSVEVQPGDTVPTGATLATLDDADLQDEVDAARADLDEAELVLERALAGEDVSGLTGVPSGGTALGGGMATGVVLPVPRATATSDDGGLGAAQQAVLDAQSAVSDATSLAATALETAAAACASGEEEGGDATACRDALEQAFTAQQALTTAQTTLTDAATALTELLAERAEQPPGGSDSGTPPDTGSVPDDGSQGTVPEGSMPEDGGSADGGPSGSAPSGSTPEASETTSEPTAEELIAYQKAVDAAEATLTVAEQAVGQARIVSPISGTVVSVGLATGDEVEAASATATVVIVSEGGYEVTALVDVGDLPDIELGQAAHVQPDGERPAIEGEVVRIGVTGTSSGASTTYPVTIGLTDQPSSLGNGSTATVEVVTAGATEAVAVPTSAVTATDGAHTVQVLDGTEATDVPVEVGAIGDTWTEITEGVEVGDTVVLADLDEALPGSATDSSSTSDGGGGGAGGGDLPAGVFPGGGGGPPSFGGPGG
ncbi:MAG TPA: HlyD family efflux transporter periplasmic adaptor subunit [Iamia sp.]